MTTNPTCLPVGGGQSSRLRGARDAVAGDLFLYRSGPRAWFLAAPAAETFALLHSHLAPGVSLENAAPNRAALAVQGPHAPAVYQHVAGAHAELPDPNGFTEFYSLRGGICSIARTSLTSEDGFLFFCDADEAPFWWSEFTEHGAQPCGFAALDSLRRETSADPGPRAARPPEPPPDLPP